MTYICENDKCNKEFEDNTQGEIEEIDRDKYSTMYREEKVVVCPYCGSSMEVSDEYWENNETGDISR